MQQRLMRILYRARRAYRVHHAIRGALAAAIAGSAVAFFALLLTGLGLLDGEVWRLLAPLAVSAVVVGAVLGLLRPLDDGSVLSRLDADNDLQNGLVTARELLSSSAPMPPLAMAHVRSSIERAERMGLGRTIAADLGARAKILGILCLCIVSVALI